MPLIMKTVCSSGVLLIVIASLFPLFANGDTDNADILRLGEQVTCLAGPRPACTGTPSALALADMSVLSKAKDFDFGLRHGCLLNEKSQTLCWGDNSSGQLGTKPHPHPKHKLRRPIQKIAAMVEGLPALKSLSAGWFHTCGVSNNGELWCWGDNTQDQLGHRGASPRPRAGPTFDHQVVAISSGGMHTCAVDTHGDAYCWGDGSFGQLGDDKGANSLTAVKVKGLDASVSSLVSGAYHTCALLKDGSAYCWGYNRLGQLGDGTRQNSRTPTPVKGLNGAVQMLAAGGSFSCALLDTGEAQCWGSNEFGELGNGDTQRKGKQPISFSVAGNPVVGITAEIDVINAAGTHACAVTISGKAYCWGGNGMGQLGDGTVESHQLPAIWSGIQPIIPRPEILLPHDPIEGIDVSYHSGFVNWKEARDSGFQFAFTLATAGLDFHDPFFSSHWDRMRQAGIIRGAYHFYVPEDDPLKQARFFLSTVTFAAGDLLPVVDVESASGDAPEKIAEGLAVFSDEIEKLIGVKPIIYTNPHFWKKHIAGKLDFGRHPLWISNYEVEHPAVPSAWSHWQLWQWKSDADLPNISPMVDLNRIPPDFDIKTVMIPSENGDGGF